MRSRGKQVERAALLVAALGILTAAIPGRTWGQEPRLEGRIAEPVRSNIDAILDRARAEGLPTEPLVDRALEGASKGAAPERILAAVERLSQELRVARDALGVGSSEAEIVAGASALRAGAEAQDLAQLRATRSARPLTVAAAVLADLVAVGVPVDTAVSAVLALAAGVDDVEYIAFRRNVERDIALGASPVTAIGVRLAGETAAEEFANVDRPGATRPPSPRKP